MRKFWNFVNSNRDDVNLNVSRDSIVNDAAESERTLYLNGAIADEGWWSDDVTPKAFKADLDGGSGNLTVWINSPGGDVFAAAQIYTMLKEYSVNGKGRVTVKIDGLAASAASVVAMSGDRVLMSPVSMIMLHNPATIAFGDSEEMLRAKAMLDEVKESIVNAYETKTGLARAEISRLMDDETWLNAYKAVEMGFADDILYSDSVSRSNDSISDGLYSTNGVIFSRATVTNALLARFSNVSDNKHDNNRTKLHDDYTKRASKVDKFLKGETL